MKFKEWMAKIEEAAPQKSNAASTPFAGFANTASRFGSAATQLPVPGGLDDLDNALYAGLAGGVGKAMSRNFQRMGHNISQLDRIEPRPKDGKPHTEHGTLPLQLPIVDGVAILGQNFTYGKSGVKNLRDKVMDRSYEDPQIRKKDDSDLNEIAPAGKFELYNSANNNRNDPIRSYQTATNFTQALIHVIVRDKVERTEELRNKYDAETIKLESSQVNDEDNTITCVFSFRPKEIINKGDGHE